MTINAAPTDLTGKTALVTGASGGIGLAVVAHFATLGATVYATDVGDSFDGPATYRSFDLLDENGLVAACEWIAEIEPNILFNNAAVFDVGSVLDADLDQFDRLFGVNVRGFYAVMQAAAKSMVARKSKGSIVNLASQAGHRGEALVAHYCATKAAVISYTQSAALALAPNGIRVNAISPGVIDTPMGNTSTACSQSLKGKRSARKSAKSVGLCPWAIWVHPTMWPALQYSLPLTSQPISLHKPSASMVAMC